MKLSLINGDITETIATLLLEKNADLYYDVKQAYIKDESCFDDYVEGKLDTSIYVLTEYFIERYLEEAENIIYEVDESYNLIDIEIVW